MAYADRRNSEHGHEDEGISNAVRLVSGSLRLLMIAAVALAPTASSFAMQSSAPSHAHAHRVAPADTQEPADEQPAAPIAPLAPAVKEAPASPPQVSYNDGQLTIVAMDSTLADILAAVRERTGADIDIPTGAASRERMAAQLGPGPPREVLAALLSWSDFDYIISGSAGDPKGIRTVLLTPRDNRPSNPGRSYFAVNSEAETTPEAPAVAEQAPASPDVTPAAVAAQTPMPADDSVDTAARIAIPNASPTAPEMQPRPQDQPGKNRGEMIQDLQHMYQERQAMGQNATPQNATPKDTKN
jgi:hypothetical protein